MKHILLFKIGAIGDVLMTTPFIRQLHKQFPGLTVDYLVWSWSAGILKGNPYIHDIIPFDASIFSSKNPFSLWKMFRMLREMKHKYDAAVIFDKHRIFGLLFRLAGFKKRIWFDRAGKGWRFLTKKIFWDASKREVEYNLDILTLLWGTPDYDDQSYDMHIPDHVPARDKKIYDMKSTAKKIVCISTWWGNPMTTAFHKDKDCRRWNIKNREILTEKLLERWDAVFLLWSSTDRTMHFNHPLFHDLRGKTSLQETAYIISKSALLVTSDNGLMHIGGCTATELLALFWPTDPYHKYPYITSKKRHPIGWIRKESKECYDMYGRYDSCTGKEIDKITVQDVLDHVH